jgi:hypothetical protein
MEVKLRRSEKIIEFGGIFINPEGMTYYEKSMTSLRDCMSGVIKITTETKSHGENQGRCALFDVSLVL